MVEFIENHPKAFKIKLKIPRNENEEEEEDNKVVDGKIQSKEKVCEVCKKVFGSGKALGGHMRIHFRAYDNKDHRVLKEKKKKRLRTHQPIKFKKFKKKSNIHPCGGVDEPICVLCGKIFASMKSLFGHMRSHPEREWRGIHPRPSASASASASQVLTAKNSTVSCSLNSSNNGELIDGDLGGNEEVFEPRNLLEILPKWSVTAKRGRKGGSVVNDDVEQEFREAVDDLLMLAKGGRGDSCDHQSSGLMKKHQKGKGTKLIVEAHDHLQTFMNELVNEEEGEGSTNGANINNVLMKSTRKCNKNVIGSDDGLASNESSLIGKEGLIVKNKKERMKKVKVRDINEIQDQHAPIPLTRLMSKPNKDHRFRIFIENSIDDHHGQYNSPPSVDNESAGKKVMMINKESKENDEHHHQYLCEVSNIFHSSHGVEGHKLCQHWNNNISPLLDVDSHSNSIKDEVVTNTTGRVLLDFDLNELPHVQEDIDEAHHHIGG